MDEWMQWMEMTAHANLGFVPGLAASKNFDCPKNLNVEME